MTDNAEGSASAEQAKGANPGVTDADIPADQKVIPNDQGIPAAPKMSNEPPELTVEQKAAAEKDAAKKAQEEKAKLAVADEAKQRQEQADAEKAKADEANKTEDDKAKDEKVEYVKYDHPAADAAVEMLKSKGINPKEAQAWFAEAAKTGDLSKIDVKAMREKLGDTDAALVESAVKDYYSGAANTARDIANSVIAEVGSQDNFNTVKDWALAQEATSPEFATKMADLRKMMDLGKNSAILAIRELKTMYNADPKNATLDTRIVHGDSTSSDAAGLISRVDYITQLKAAEAKGDKAEITRLNALRRASIGKK